MFYLLTRLFSNANSGKSEAHINHSSSEIPNISLAEKCANFIKPFEGFYPKEYYCPAGYLTIGYGTLIKEHPELKGKKISEAQADGYLVEELDDKFIPAVMRLCKVTEEKHIIAISSFVYNLGIGALERSTLRMKINRGEFEDCGVEFLKWNKAKVKGVLTPLKGLTIRRMAERNLFLS